jgi:iron(III) transport system permease protein
VLLRRLLIGGAIVLFALVCILPAAYMIAMSFVSTAGAWTIANYTRLLFEARQRELLWTTITLGVSSSLISLFVGVPLGFVLARLRLPGIAFLRVALLSPLVIPPSVLALVWIFVTGHSSFSYSLSGAALVLGVGLYPLPMLAAEAGFRRVHASLEEAGLMTTNRWHVFLRITLPLVAPLLAAAGLLVFALSVAEFGVPGLLRVRVFTTEVFTAFAALYDFGRATALAVPLLLITLFAVVMARWCIGERLLVAGSSWRPALLRRNALRDVTVFAGVLAIVAMVLGVPIAVLAARARDVAANIVPAWPAVRTSILLSVIAATAAAIIGAFLGYARGRMRPRWGLLTDLLLIGAFALPSTVVGVGIIGVWNRPVVPLAWYASPMVIILGYMARFLPVAVLIIAAGVRQVSLASEEAAEICGVSWLRSFSRIVIPQVRGSLIAAWVAVFVFTFGEVGTTVLVSPPGQSTLPVRMYSLIANARDAEVATLALIQVLAAIVPMGLFGLTFGRIEKRP